MRVPGTEDIKVNKHVSGADGAYGLVTEGRLKTGRQRHRMMSDNSTL